MRTVNLAAYKFVAIAEPSAWRQPLLERCIDLKLRGTILLAPEGINLFLAGTSQAVQTLLNYLRKDALFEGAFADLQGKQSESAAQPFKRMLVKLKREIITMHASTIHPEQGRAPTVDAHTLKRWLDAGQDDAGRPVVMLDTRNDFEIKHGTFEGALDLHLERFSEFPAAVAARRDDFAGKAVVSFCTGGIRCEKAALHMAEIGIDSVYQLEGGILKYFEEVGGAHYTGTCFVFDQRVELDARLLPASLASPTTPGVEPKPCGHRRDAATGTASAR